MATSGKKFRIRLTSGDFAGYRTYGIDGTSGFTFTREVASKSYSSNYRSGTTYVYRYTATVTLHNDNGAEVTKKVVFYNDNNAWAVCYMWKNLVNGAYEYTYEDQGGEWINQQLRGIVLPTQKELSGNVCISTSDTPDWGELDAGGGYTWAYAQNACGVIEETTDDDEESGDDDEDLDPSDYVNLPVDTSGSSIGGSGSTPTASGNNEYMTFTAPEIDGYVFQKWSNNSTDNPLTIKVSDIPAGGLSPIYKCVYHTFSCTTSGNAATITAKVDSATVATPSSFNANDGSTVGISATPTNDGDEISYWTVGGVRHESQAITMDIDDTVARNVSVVCHCITPQRFKLTVSKTNGDCGTIAMSGNGKDYLEVGGTIEETLECNTNYTLTATLNDSSLHRFLGWYNGETQLSSALTYILNRSELTDYAIVAKFEEIPYYKCELEKATEDTIQYDGYIGCGMTTTPSNDITIDGVDKWLSTQMSIAPVCGSGYDIVKWVVTDLDGGNNGFTNPAAGSLTGVSNPLVFTLNFNAKVKAYFGRCIFHARSYVETESAGGGTCTVTSHTQGHDCDNLVNGDQVTFTATSGDGFVFSRWQNASGVSVSTSASFTVTINGADLDYYAVFIDSELGPSVIQKWNAGTTNRMQTWRSKVYASSQPTSPVTLRVDAKFYPVIVKIGTFSSPAAATEEGGETRWVQLTISDQNARRLPALRPERYVVIQVKSRGEVDAIYLGTSMIGIAG